MSLLGLTLVLLKRFGSPKTFACIVSMCVSWRSGEQRVRRLPTVLREMEFEDV
jgi:hypothetical protein